MTAIKTLKVRITTADQSGADTGDHVWLDVGGAAFDLTAAGHKPFHRAATNEIALDVAALNLTRDDVWRVVLSKAPGSDSNGWRLDGLELTDETGHVYYARQGIHALLDGSTNRQWQAPDFTGVAPPAVISVGAELLEKLLEAPLLAQLHGTIGGLHDVTPMGELGVACECDGIHIEQNIRGSIGSIHVTVKISGRLKPNVVVSPDGRTTDLSVDQVFADIHLPVWIAIVTGGMSEAALKGLDPIVSGIVQTQVKHAIAGQLGGLNIDLSHVARFGLRPGAMEVIQLRAPRILPDHGSRPFSPHGP